MILFDIEKFSIKNIHMKMSSGNNDDRLGSAEVAEVNQVYNWMAIVKTFFLKASLYIEWKIENEMQTDYVNLYPLQTDPYENN